MPNQELNQPPLFDRITLLREMGGLSLNKAAQQSRVSTGYLYKLEKGEIKTPSPHKLKAIAEGIGTSYGLLFALAGYSQEYSPQEVDPILRLAEIIGVKSLSFEETRFLFNTVYGMRLAREVGIPTELSGRMAVAAIRAQRDDPEGMNEIINLWREAQTHMAAVSSV